MLVSSYLHFFVPELDTGSGEHSFRSYRFRFMSMLIGHINHFSNTRLNDDFCTLITWKKTDVNRTIFHIRAIFIQDSVHFRMTDWKTSKKLDDCELYKTTDHCASKCLDGESSKISQITYSRRICITILQILRFISAIHCHFFCSTMSS